MLVGKADASMLKLRILLIPFRTATAKIVCAADCLSERDKAFGSGGSNSKGGTAGGFGSEPEHLAQNGDSMDVIVGDVIFWMHQKRCDAC